MLHPAPGRSNRLPLLIALLVGSGAACGQPGLEEEEPPAGATSALAAADDAEPGEPPLLPVVGGEITAECGVPMTAKIPGCTATLVAPTILLTARHCNPKANMLVQFGEKAPFAFSVRATKCVSARDSDSAYCVLPEDERLKRVPTVPVLHGCEYDKFMKRGARLLGVGFGDTRGTGPRVTKMEVEVPVVRVRGVFIDVGDATHDLCFGDSGGGAYIRLQDGDKDWGWRMVGTVTGTARVPGGAPCGGTNYTTVLRHIRLIEENEGIDITPCTDETGAWDPGPGCTGFLTDIQTGGGAWPACNYGARTTAPIDSCDAGPAVPGTMPPGAMTPGTMTPPGPAVPPPPGTMTPPGPSTPPLPPGTPPPPLPVPPPAVPAPSIDPLPVSPGTITPAPGGPPPATTTPPPPAPAPAPAPPTSPGTMGAAPPAPAPSGPPIPGTGLTSSQGTPPTLGPDAPRIDGTVGCQVARGPAPASLVLPLALLALAGVRRRRAR